MKKIISTTNAPAAVGPYSQAVKAGPFLFCSGQIGVDPSTGQFAEGGVKEQAGQVMKNVQAVLEAAGYSLKDVLKATVFAVDMNDFSTVNEMPQEFLPVLSLEGANPQKNPKAGRDT